MASFCQTAARHILAGVTFAELRARLAPLIPGLLDLMEIPAEARMPGLQDSMATLIGMEIWNATPIPDNGFRPRKLAKPERNALCY